MRGIYIALGSNVEPLANIPRALDLLRQATRVLAVSPCYRNAAVGPAICQSEFINAVIELESPLQPQALKELLRKVETSLGRKPDQPRYSPRAIDLDLLLMGSLLSQDPLLPLPHPDLLHRDFVFHPLLDIAPLLILPDSGLPLASLVPPLSRPLIPVTLA